MSFRISLLALCCAVALLSTLPGTPAVGQTGPDIDAIKRNHKAMLEAERKEREAELRKKTAAEQWTAATRPSAERVKQLEAEVATRPTLSEVETLRAEVDRLRAALQTVTQERDALKQQLEVIRAAAGK